VVHQIRDTGHRAGVDRQLREQLGAGARRRLDRRRAGAVDVVEEPHLDPAASRVAQRAGDRVAGRSGQPEVVQRQLERALRAAQEVDDPGRDVVGALATVVELVYLHGARF
jgi:hypothetical protein